MPVTYRTESSRKPPSQPPNEKRATLIMSMMGIALLVVCLILSKH